MQARSVENFLCQSRKIVGSCYFTVNKRLYLNNYKSFIIYKLNYFERHVIDLFNDALVDWIEDKMKANGIEVLLNRLGIRENAFIQKAENLRFVTTSNKPNNF